MRHTKIENMGNWTITASTIYCEAVDDEVTLMVYKDGTAICTGSRKYAAPDRSTSRLLKKKSRQLKRALKCGPADCGRLVQYRDKMIAERSAG